MATTFNAFTIATISHCNGVRRSDCERAVGPQKGKPQQDTSHHSRNPQGQTRLTHHRGGQARAAAKVAAPPPHQLSRKLLRILDRLGCFSFLSALASIWRMRSRVTENCWPTSSSVWSLFMPMPKRMRSTRSSRGVKDANTRVVVSRKLD